MGTNPGRIFKAWIGVSAMAGAVLLLAFFPVDRLTAQVTGNVNLNVPDQGKKTMTRTADFIVVQGKELKKSLGNKISQFALLASVDGTIQPIPFQVDELNPEDEWVLPSIPQGAKRSGYVEEDEDRGALDCNDQLVFMIRDSGDQIPEVLYPKEAKVVEEITLRDPLTGYKSWVYLCTYDSNPPLSEADYAGYDITDNRVFTPDYDLSFSKTVPVSWGHISFRGAPNMIDRMKIRFFMKVFGISFTKNEEDFKTELSFYKDGPVRVIRRVRSSISINSFIRTPSAASESIYYDNSIVIPFRIKIPVSMKSLHGIVSDVKVQGGADMQNLHGWTMRTSAEDVWYCVDGHMDETEKALKTEGVTWFVLTGPPGGYLCRIILNRKPDGSPQSLPIKTAFYYVDDDNLPDPPEFVPGQSPNLGFWMTGFEGLQKGCFYFYMIGYMMRDYQRGKELEYLDIMDRPVEISTR